jgi:hypothetical protein
MLTASNCVKFGFSVQTSYPLMRSLYYIYSKMLSFFLLLFDALYQFASSKLDLNLQSSRRVSG